MVIISCGQRDGIDGVKKKLAKTETLHELVKTAITSVSSVYLGF